jgi:glycosyltransferase involved in cell wall biosynthesis
MIAAGVKAPVRVVPHPVSLTMPMVQPDRAAFGIPNSATAVLCMGDHNSSIDRKNLLGSIAIYVRAFPVPDQHTFLVIKTQADEEYPQFKGSARRIIGDRTDIVFLSGVLPHHKVYSLIASCDLVLSPHRSEGFGLTLAEAFLLGVPALATGWSGNVDFMQGLEELVIRSDLVPVRDRSGVYRERDQKWADPDVYDASQKLRALVASKALRRVLAERGGLAVKRMEVPWQLGGTVAKLLAPYLVAGVPVSVR